MDDRIKLYEEMNAKIADIIAIEGDPSSLYASAYIKDLRAENDRLKAEKEQIRKETAKGILQDISDTYEKEVLYGTPTVREKIEELAALYQVEVGVNE